MNAANVIPFPKTRRYGSAGANRSSGVGPGDRLAFDLMSIANWFEHCAHRHGCTRQMRLLAAETRLLARECD